MTDSLASKLCLKQSLHFHRITEITSLQDHLVAFKEILTDLDTLEVKYDEDL